MRSQIYRRLILSEEVRSAFASGKGVVALESSVITQGLPYPENLKAAKMIEQAVRDEKAVPATIAVIKGVIKVGLSEAELKHLANPEKEHMKLSRRDLPLALSTKKTGGTTVAATMFLADGAGIKVFATGGIGGVHIGAENNFDVSADLEELSKTNMCVISAGAKAVLDLPKTLEVLETKGVPVIGYNTDEFPAFYYNNSGLKTSGRLDTPKDIAKLMTHKWNLGRFPDHYVFQGGLLIANPVPEETALKRDDVERHIARAVKGMKAEGKDVTPYLLDKISRQTKGKSLECNVAVLKNNAQLAARIAKRLVKMVVR